MLDERFRHLRLRLDAGVATLTLARPAAMNALNMELKHELAVAIKAVGDDPAVRCVVVTGEGKAFSAGGDIGEMSLNINPLRSRNRLQVLLREVFVPLAEMEKPTIAAVNGHAHGAGLSLALACDLVVASSEATLSCAFSKLGLLPDCGSLYFLPRRTTPAMAKELVFTGRRVPADEAKAIGLVNEVVSADELEARVGALAAPLAAAPTAALGLAKRLLDQSQQLSLHEMSTLEAMGQAILYSTDDFHAAQDGFLNQNSPTFTGT